MKKFITSFLGLLLLAHLALAQEDVYETVFLELKKGASEEQVQTSLKLIKVGGKKAFPSLLKHLKNGDPASQRHFQRSVISEDPVTGEQRLHPPTMGEVAFDLILGAIDAAPPEAYLSLQILTPENLGAWLGKHSGKPLVELKLIAAEEIYSKAKARATAQPSKHATKALIFAKRKYQLAKSRLNQSK